MTIIHKSSTTDLNTKNTDCVEGEVRLRNGDDESEGRIELCINHAWGTICGSYWASIDSNVVCRQLGHMELGN